MFCLQTDLKTLIIIFFIRHTLYMVRIFRIFPFFYYGSCSCVFRLFICNLGGG